MKKQLLFVALSALVGGGNLALADTTVLTQTDGWTKITSITQSDIANNYYVIVDNASDLMLGLAVSSQQGDNGRSTADVMFYQGSSSDITNDLYKVWILEKYNSDYALRNLGKNQLQLQTEWASVRDLRWRQNDQPASCEWTGLSLAYADGKWALTSTKYSCPLGIYNNETTAPVEGSEIGANSPGNGASFQIYAIARTKFLELYKNKLSTASATSPRNATLLITNPDFNANNSNGWNIVTGKFTNIKYGAAEFWHESSFEINQALTGLPNGKYEVSVQAAQENVKTAQLYAITSLGTTTATVTTETSKKLENWNELGSNGILFGRDESLGKISVEVTVTDGNLTIGFKDADPSNHWVVFDNFTMQYLGEVDLTEYVTNYNTALTAAKNISQDSPMNTSVKTALSTAITNYNNVSKTDKDALVEATSALNTAATNATASIEAYAKAKTILENVDKFINSTNFYTADAINTYKTNDYTTPKNKYDAGTLTNDEIAKLQDPHDYGGYKGTLNVSNVLRSTWTDTSLNINVWSTEGETDGTNFVRPFVEWWRSESDGPLVAGTKTGTLELGEGSIGKAYEVTANVRVMYANNQTEAKGMIMNVNDGASVNVCDGTRTGSTARYLKEGVKAYGLVGDDKKLNINFTASSDNTISWLAFKDVKYTQIPLLDEEANNTIEAATEANVAVKRSFTANAWNSVVLPFSMTKDQVKAFFGEGTKTATFTGATAGENNTITLNFITLSEDNATITANTPCLVYPTKNLTFAVAEGVSVVAPDEDASLVTTGTGNASTNNLVDFVGTYKKGGLSITTKDYFLSTDNKLYQAKGDETIKAFRAIFRLKDNKSDGAKVVMSLDGYDETTSIQNLGKTEAVKNNVYNLAGQLVKRNATSLNGLQKGLYIVNGKKVVVD